MCCLAGPALHLSHASHLALPVKSIMPGRAAGEGGREGGGGVGGQVRRGRGGLGGEEGGGGGGR